MKYLYLFAALLLAAAPAFAGETPASCAPGHDCASGEGHVGGFQCSFHVIAPGITCTSCGDDCWSNGVPYPSPPGSAPVQHVSIAIGDDNSLPPGYSIIPNPDGGGYIITDDKGISTFIETDEQAP